MQKRRNDVKARTTLLLAFPNKHQLRFSKYKTAQELWAAILNTFGGNKATKKTKKNQLKQQYGNFKTEGKETLEQTFNRLHAIVSHLKFIDVEIEQDDMNQKFLTSLAPEWLMYTIVWRNRSDLDTMSLDDLYNHLKVYDPEVQKKSESNSQNMAFISSAKNSSGKEEVNTASFPTTSTQVSPASANVAAASFSHDTFCAYIASQSNGSQIKYEDINHIDEDDIKEMDIKIERLTNELEELKKEKEGLDSKLTDDTITNSNDLQSSNSSVSENGESSSSILSKPVITFVKAADSPTVIKTNKDETIRKSSINMLKCIEKLQRVLIDFKLKDDTNVLLRTPRQHNMYSIDLKNILPHKDLTCLVAKASADESILWHRRLGHLNFKTMNKLVRHNLVRGLPSKCFENDHTCVACLKGKQHKASCKTKLVNLVSKPLYTLHMDLFGPTSVSSLNHKWYCFVMTDDFSRFTWTFFLKTKDETSGILRNFITEIENIKGVLRNKTLIEAARTMLADAKLPVTFWAEAVNTACYVQNRALVNKSQNKTPYELFNGRTPAIGFLKPFGCHVMILNTLDNLGKFDAKGDECYFIWYSMSSKTFRVFNKRTKRVKENLHVDFLKNKLIEKGAGPNWLFDIDTLTNSMNYVPVVVTGTSSTDFSGTKDAASQDVKKDLSSLRYIALPNWFHEAHLESSTSNAQDACNADAPESMESAIPTVSLPVPTACLDDSPKPSSDTRLISKRVTSQDDTPSLDNILNLSNRFRDILGVTINTDDTYGVEADLGNMENNISASPTPTFRIHNEHPKSQIIGPVDTPVQTRTKSKEAEEQRVRPIGTKWVLKNKKDERGIVIRNKAILVAQGHTQEEEIDYEEVFAPVTWIETIRLFLAYASFMGFTVYQMDVKSAFLYGTIDEKVYVMQPPRFQDPKFPARVYKVEKAMYGLHQAPRALYVLQKKDGIFLSQDKYVGGDILKKIGYSDVRSANTPMDKENPWGKDGTDKDTIVATSTTEAEYVAAASGCGQVPWIQN
nr:hypothetical protein [Tanacetum cinerariifolium]